jgi:hypothetical protein
VRRFVAARAPGRAGLVLAGATAAATVLTPFRYVQPFGDQLEPAPVAPLAPAVAVMALGFATVNTMSIVETGRTGRLVRARVSWAVVLLAGSVLGAAAAAALAEPSLRVPMVRNGLGMAGASLLGAAAFGARLAWLPAFACAVATFAAGRDALSGAVRPWALLLAPGDSGVAAAVAGACALAGVVAYAVRDSRPATGVVGE